MVEAPDKVPDEALGLRRRAARGMLINAVFLAGLTSLGLIKGFVVAGFLSRSDYGVWGLLVVTLGTLGWLKQIGVSDRYVQQSDDDQELAFQRAFTLEILFSGAFFVLAAAVVALTAVLYGRPGLLAPGFALLLTIPAYILQSPLWVFYKRMEFLRQRRLEVLEPLVGFVVTVGLAIAGAGYWSLIVGMVAGAWVGALAILRVAPYRPAFRYESGTVRQYLSFSWPLAVAGVGGIAVAQGSIIAGNAVLGLAGVGSIALASTIVLYTTQVDQIVSQTLYPAICAVSDKPDLLFESFVKSNRLGLMWGVPLGVAIALFMPDLVDFGLGARWRPAVALIQIFGLIAAADQIAFNWDDYYRARAETRPIAARQHRHDDRLPRHGDPPPDHRRPDRFRDRHGVRCRCRNHRSDCLPRSPLPVIRRPAPQHPGDPPDRPRSRRRPAAAPARRQPDGGSRDRGGGRFPRRDGRRDALPGAPAAPRGQGIPAQGAGTRGHQDRRHLTGSAPGVDTVLRVAVGDDKSVLGHV